MIGLGPLTPFRISIHALREEGDLRPDDARESGMAISIHALREEGDQGNTAALSVTTIFLSTPSARRATADVAKQRVDFLISIHALREEGDELIRDAIIKASRFLSTPSARRATCVSVGTTEVPTDFYPRPPRGGRRVRCKRAPRHQHFYPRPPRGGRHWRLLSYLCSIRISIHALREEGDILQTVRKAHVLEFLSTPSARRATASCWMRL